MKNMKWKTHIKGKYKPSKVVLRGIFNLKLAIIADFSLQKSVQNK